MARRIARVILVILVALAALLIGAAMARAASGAGVLRADPPDGAMLARSPREVRVWLSQTVDMQETQVTLVDSSGRPLAIAGSAVESYLPTAAGLADSFDARFLWLCSTSPGHRPSLLTVRLPALDAGTYQLVWKSKQLFDRRDLLGAIVFRVDPAASSDGAVVDAAPATAAQRAGDLLIGAAVSPNRPGQNFLDLTITNTRRPAPAPIERVDVTVLAPGGRGAPADLDAERLGEGRYRIAGLPLDRAGEWSISVTIRRPRMADATATLSWTIAAPQRPGSALPLVGRAPLTVALTVAALCGLALTAFAFRRRPAHPPVLAAQPARRLRLGEQE